MAVFLDYKLQLPPNEDYACSAWSDEESILAVALKSQEVHFFGDEGFSVTDAVHSRKGARVMKLAWQPKGKFLIVGWTDGGISVWDSKDETAGNFATSPHKSPIRLLEWAPYGNRFVTSDERGIVVVWKIDVRGSVTQFALYRRSGIMTQLAFCTSAHQREKHRRGSTISQNICPSFFFGGENGSVHYADDLGHITDVHSLNAGIESMMFYEEKSRLVIITQNMLLVQLQMGVDGAIKPIMKVKLSISSDGALNNVIWAGKGLLATSSDESLIRFFDLSTATNYVLNLSSAGQTIDRSDNIGSISFNPRARVIAAGTRDGNIAFWRFIGGDDDSSDGSGIGCQQWEFVATTQLPGKIRELSWGPDRLTLSADVDSVPYVLNQSTLHRSITKEIAVIQSSPKCISVERHSSGSITQSIVDCSIRIKNLVHDGNSILVHNGMDVEVYEFENETATLVSEFKSDWDPVGIRGDTMYRFIDCDLELCNLKGKVKHTISFTEGEGDPSVMDIQGKYLAVATDLGVIKIFELARREPKLVGSAGKFDRSMIEGLGFCTIRSIKVNADGTRVSILADTVEGVLDISTPMSKIYVFNVDDSSFSSYDFGSSRHPCSHFWDPEESRILVCETFRDKFAEEKPSGESPEVENNADDDVEGKEEDPLKDESKDSSINIKSSLAVAEKEVTTFFATLESGLKMQDTFEMDSKHSALLGVQVPYLFFAAKQKDEDRDNPLPMLRPKVMRDFVGLDKVEKDVRCALVDFSYYITMGNMDEAYRSVKLIQNPSVWENMANMCVKTRRLDVAEVCLGNMGHARGAAAVRHVKQTEPEVEVAVAMVAIQLGLLDDAARLYKECKRYDLLNKLYSSAGYWGKALNVANDKDKLHLQSTNYLYAQHLEQLGEKRKAIKHYELADAHYKEVPRMMYGKNRKRMEELQDYVDKSKDKRLYKWWGNQCENKQDYEQALHYYRRAKDPLSLVRVHCFNSEFDAAADIVQSTESKDGAYHLARTFESSGAIPDAIHFYATAGCYHQAIRLAREHNLDSDMMKFALMSSKSDMLDCARFFEARNQYDKAVQLFRKGGDLSKALDLCFKGELFDIVHSISDDLGPDAPADILNKCADFFWHNQKYEKTVHLLLMRKRFHEALEICSEQNVKVSEEMAEMMTLPKSDRESENAKRLDLLKKLAKCCRQQGSYHLATKKYTQAGDKIKAMKCLLKSGDTEKVIFFAGVSRNKDIYILAANYLQNLDWHESPDVMKNIISFYTKAKAYERLSTFYESCAQVEIDEYRDYEKAVSAFKESVKFMSKSKSEDKDTVLASLQQRIYLVEQFVAAKSFEKSDPAEMVSMLRQLLDQEGVETAIRVGDAFSILVEHYVAEDSMEQAYHIIERMRSQRIPLKPYVDSKLLARIEEAVGVSVSSSDSKSKSRHESDDDGIDEDIDEELEHSDYKE